MFDFVLGFLAGGILMFFFYANNKKKMNKLHMDLESAKNTIEWFAAKKEAHKEAQKEKK